MGTHFQVDSLGKHAFDFFRKQLSRLASHKAATSTHSDFMIDSDKKNHQEVHYIKMTSRSAGRRKKLQISQKRASIYLLVGLFSIFSAASYYSYQTYKNNSTKSYSEIIAINKEKVSNALEALDKALTLIEKRIQKQSDSPQAISEILNTDFKTIIDGPFPTVLSINLRQPNKTYSRLGLEGLTDSLLGTISGSATIENEHVFVVEREIVNLGVLIAKISIEGLLSDRFVRKDEILEVPSAEGFTVKLNGVQHTYCLDRVRPTFWGFLEDYSDFFRLLVIASLGFTFFGASSVSYFVRKHNKMLRAQKEDAIQKYKAAYRSCSEQELNLAKQKSITKYERAGFQKREELLKLTIKSLQQMAYEGLKTNPTVINFLVQEAVENNAVAEILKMAFQANQKLKDIASGFPYTNEDSNVNLKEALDDVLAAFTQKTNTQDIGIKIEDQYKRSVTTDLVALSIVLYNLLGGIFSKFVSRLKIEIEGNDEFGVSIRFEDNRHVSEATIEETSGKDILSLSEQQLSDLARVMGWKISFEIEEDLSKTILWLPNEALRQGNVVSFQGYKKHA
jgi:hypothetical protein